MKRNIPVSVSRTVAAILILIFNLSAGSSWGQTPVPMASQPSLTYTETFNAISTWSNNFGGSVTAETRWKGFTATSSGSVPSATAVTVSTVFSTGSTAGVQKGTNNMVFLSTGTTSNTTSTAADFFMDFTGVNAGTLSVDLAGINNGGTAGDRGGTLKIYWSTDGSSWTELTTTNLPFSVVNSLTPGSASISGLALPSAFNNSATARLRFYYYNGPTTGTGGSRPKISIDNLVVTAVSSGCSTAPTSVSASPSATILCSGATLTLTGAATGATSYSWSGPNSFSSTLLSPAAFTVGTASAGVYTLSATNACGTTTVTSAAITINTAPTGVSATPSATSLCNGATLTLTGAATGATSYLWSGPNSYSSTLLNPASFAAGPSSGSYTLAATNSCGTASVATTSVTIQTAPTAVTATPSATSVCSGSTLTLTGAATGATSYAWSGPNAFSSTLLTPAAFTVGTASAGSYTLAATNSCGTTTVATTAITIGTLPTAVTATPSSTSICTGSTLALTGAATGATSYGWSGPNSFSSTLLNPASFSVSTLSAGIYTLTATNSCGSTVATTASVTVNSLPSAPSFSGTATIAYGASTTLSLSGGANDVVYYWTGAGTANTTLSAGGTGSFTVAPSSTTTYSVTSVTSSLGCTLSSITGVTVTITVTGSPADTIPTMDDNMAMGNPSGATTSTSDVNNYLMVKPQYSLSYNNSKGEANWVSWHLSTAWKGSAVRCDCFYQDSTLPSGYYRAATGNYTGSGFDRGHMCPSDDRDLNDADNMATFKMINIAPQAPNLNQITWESLESYCRALIYAGNELYIISGGYGSGGTGSAGSASTIASGNINVPSRYFKVVVVLPVGTNDVNRVTTSTRVIAVDMPNTQTVNSQPWGYYRTSVDAIEAATGYDFLSNVPTGIQSVIEAGVDNGPTNVLAWDLTGTGGDATFAATSVSSSLDATSDLNTLTRGSGAAASTGANSFRTTGFQNNGISTSNTDYFQVKMKPVSGKRLSLSTIDATCTGTTSFAASPGVTSQFAYSFDGTTFTLIGSPMVTVGAPVNLTTVNVSSISALQNIPSTSTLYIRYYASGQTTTGGWGFYSQYSGNYGLSFDGSFTDEPCTTAPTAVSANLSSATVCNGGTITLSGAATSVGATTYSWTGPNSYSSTTLSPASFTVGTASAGVYTLVATNACGSTTVTTAALTVDAGPTSVSATPSSTSLCSGNTLTLTGTATGATSYSWSGPNSYSSTDLNPASFTVGTASAGAYTLAASNSCGTTTVTTASVAVTTIPTVAAISGSTTVTVGGNITLTNATAGGTWTSGTTSVATITSGGMVTGVSIGSSIISYSVSNLCGSTTTTLAVNVTAAPDVTTFSFTAGTATATSSTSAQVPVAGCTAAIGNSFGTVSTPITTVSGSNTYTGATGTYNIGNAVNVTGNTTFNSSSSPYVSFTLTPNAGYAINLTGVSFGSRATGSGPAAYTISTSVAGFGTAISSGTLSTAGSWSLVSPTISSVTGASGTAITVRIYGYGGTGSPTSGTINWRLDDIKFTYTASATCSGAPTAVTATPSATTLCSGSTLTLTGTATGATTYSWSGPNSFSSTALTPASFTVNTASAGIYTLVASNPCGSTTATTTAITVNTAPALVTATPSATNICNGGTLTLTGAATGATSYSWSGPGSYSATDLNPAAFTVNTTSAGIYTLTASNSCGSTIATTPTITIGTAPTGVSATATSTVCVGGTITLNGTATGATSYSWSGPGGYASTDMNPAGFSATTGSAGIYTLTATNSCGSTTATTTAVTVNDVPTAVSAGASPATLCTGTTITLTGSATGATAYSWSGPGSFSSTDLNPAAFTVNTASAGVYTLTATNSCGNTTATTVTVTVNGLPAPTLSGTAIMAYGSNTTLTFSGNSGDVINYSWTGGGSSSTTIGVSGTSIVTVSPTATTTYSIDNATSAAGCFASITGQSATITVDMGCTVAPTSVSATLSSASICNGGTLTLTGAATNATSYSWSGPNGFSSTDLNPAAFTVGTAAAGVYTLTATNLCGSTTATTAALTILSVPSAVSATPSATSLCSGNTLTLTGSATGATSYSWSGPSSYSSTDLNPASFTVGTASAGVYTLSATNSCGTTTATTTSVAVITVPTVAAISGSTSVAVGGNITLTNATAGGTWTSTTTSVATITSGGMVTGVSAGSSIISYTVTNTCGSTTTTLSVTVTTASDNTTFSFTAGNATATSSSSTQVPVAGCTAAIGNSFGTVSTAISTTSASSGYTGATGTFNIGNAVNVTGNTTFNSSTSPYVSFTLTPNAGYAINLTGVSFGSRATGSGPAAYTISTSVGGFGSAISTGTLSTAGSWSLVSPTITSVTGASGTAITVRIYGYGGTGSPSSGTINWRLDDIKFTYTATASCSGAPTAVTATPSATTLCSGNTLTLTGAATGATSYSWSGPNSFSSTALSPASFTVNTASAGVYTLTATNACGSTTVTTAAVAVNPLPAPTISGTTTIAAGGTATLTFSGVNGDVVNYSWTGGGSSSTTIGVSGTSVVTVSPSSTTTYSITSATSAASCSATITGQSATVTVDLGCTVAPTGVSATLSSSTLCVGNTLTLTGAATNALSYSWSGPDGYSSTLLNPASFTVGTASAGVYTLTATNACGSTTATTGTLVINVLPSSVSATPSATSLCAGNTLTLTGSATDATAYSWSGPNSYSSTDLNPASFTVGTASAGVYTLSATNSCGTTTATTTSVAVITVPTVAAISGSTSVAVGGNITLTNATAGGTWTSGTTSVATITAGGMVTGVSAGSSIISYTVTNTCGSTATTLSVTVTTASDNTTFSFTAGNATATSSSSAQVPVAGCTAAIGNSFGTVATPISTTSGSSGYTGSTGTYNIGNAVNVTGNTTFNSSTSPYVSFTLTPNTGYAINLTGVSFGSRATGSGPAAYTISTSVGGFGSAIGTGTLSTAGSWSLVSPTITSVTGASGTAITVRIYGYGGTGSPSSGTINWRLDDIKFTYTASPTCTGAPTAVSATPSAASLCSGSALTLTGAATGAISYSWSGPNSFSSTALSPASFTVNTASAGVYTFVATNPCGSTTVTTTAITVNTAPTAVSATPSATTLCDGTTLTLTGTATDATSYSWSGPGSYSATDLNPAAFTVNTASAGIYTLTASNTCGNTVATTSAITIGTTPTAVTATASAATVCLGSTLTLTGAATGADTYSWSGPEGYSSTDLNPAGITASASIAGIYSLSATNSCGSTTATTISVSVNDIPSAVSANVSATTICGGSTLTLTGAATGATSYSWSGPDSYASTDLNPAGFVVTPASAGVYTLTASNSCGNTTATTASVTVNNTPISVSASASATTLCSGSTLTLTGSATDATAYSWSGPNGYSSTDLNPAAFTVNTASAGVYTLTATNSCGIVSSTIAITISTSPVSVTATPSATSLCIGITLTLTGAATGADTYSWNGPAGFSSTDLNPAAFTVGTANAGIYSLTATNSCGSTTANTASIAVLTIPTVAAISGSSSVTVGSTITLANATAGGTWTSATTYAATVSATGTVYGVANGASIISYTVTNICGSATATLSVSVVPAVTELIGWNTSGNTGTYGPSPFAPTTLNSNLTTLSGLNRGGGVATTGTPANKAWGGADWQNTSAATAVSNGDTVNYVVKPNTGYKLSFSSFVLNYRRASSGPTAGELQYSVNGSAYTTAATLSYSSTSSSGATLPTVTLSGISALQNIPSTSSVSFRIANYGGTGSAGTWYIFDVGASTASDMYFTGTVSVDCSIAPSSVTATPSATTVCNGSTLSLTGAATNAVSYSWTGPNGFSSTAQSPAAFTVGTASAGVYTLVASNACGTVTTVTTPSITVNTIPGAASVALSATTLCSGSTLSLTGSATGATSYSWSGPGGFTATGATPAAFTVNTASAGVYTLTATNSCGSASVTSTTLTVNPLPAPTIAGTTTIITGSGTTLAFSGTAGDVVNYSWTGGGSASTTIDVSGSTIVSVTPTSTTTYSITSATSALGCAATITGQQATITVDLGCTGAPTAVTASLSAGSVCSGNTLTLTGTATDALTYSWSGPDGFTSSDLNPAGITVTGASAGIYTLSATNSCGTTTVTTASLVISTVPSAVSATASASTLCAGTTLSLTGSASGATDYSWSGPAGYTSTDANPAPFSVTTASSGIYTLTATNSCGSTTATASVSVITTPTVAAIAPASASIAAGSQVTLTNATAGGTWTISDLAVAGISGTGVVTGFSAGSATVTYTVINACGTAYATGAIAVSTPTSGTIYLNNFGATTATASDAPAILDAHLTTPTPAWTSTTALTSFGGATGQALSMSNSSGTPSYTLTLNVASGYTLQVDSFNFWRNHSASGASHWVLSINGTNVGSGDLTGTTGAYVGMTGVSTPITNLTGTVTVKLQLSGASGTGTFRLDDFQLNGIVVGHPLPVLASGPSNDTIVAGDNSSFTVTASGAASYQWQRNTSGLSGGTWTNITSASLDPAPGTYSSYSTTTTATSNTLNLSTVPATWDGYAYRCIVTNDGGSVTSSAALLSVVTPPVCSGTPTAGSATATTSTFCGSGSSTINTTGTTLATGLAYQWQSSSDSSAWSDITGATSTSYTTPVITGTTYYRMAVTCSATSLTGYTNGARITINPMPVISIPATVAICSGTSGTLVTASGAASYTWTPAAGLSATTGASVMVNTTTNRTYTITGTSAEGCISTNTMSATYNNTPATMAITPSYLNMCPSSAPQMLTIPGGALSPSAVYSGGSITINGGATAYSTSTLTASAVPAGAYITAVSVNFTASMPWQADYVINLVSPDGHILNLTNLKGIAAATTGNFSNTTVSSAGGATFPTGSAVPAATTFSADAVAGVGGSTYPSNATNFNELLGTINGDWKLVFYQATSFTNANGTLSNWSLTFNYSRSVTWSPATNLFTDAAGTVAYTGTATDTVYVAAPATTGVVNYVATSSNNGCTSSATDTINVQNGPTMSLGSIPTVCNTTPSISIPYSASTGAATYSLIWNAAALAAGFTNVTGAPLPAPYLSIATPGTTASYGDFSGVITVTDAICTGPATTLTVTLLHTPSASVTAYDAPCMDHPAGIVITGTPSSTIHYMVDSGSAVTADIDGTGTLNLPTGIITAPHNYTISSVSESICFSAIDTVLNVTPIPMQWLGGASGHETDWSTAANWSCGFVPTSADSVIITTTTYMPVLPTTVSATVNDLDIASGSTIQLNGSSVINVTGDVYNSGAVNGTGRVVMNGSSAQKLYGIGTISNLELNNSNGATIQPGARTMISSTLYLTAGTLATNDSLELLSTDTSATARIAEIPATGAAVSGRVKTDQYVQGGYRRFRFWGHSFSDTISLSQLTPYIDITGPGGSSNGFTTTTTNNPSAFRYDPYIGNDTSSYSSGWIPFTRINASAADSNRLHPGQGIRLFFRGSKGEGLGYLGYYGMYTPSATINKMIGHVNQGDVSIFLKRGTDVQTYNQISNPYPSPVDIGTVLYNARAAGQITGSAFYIWNPAIGAGGQYMAIPIGTIAAEPYYIQANTSFQVKADHDGAHVDFVESNKVPGASLNLFRAPAQAVRFNIYDTAYHLWDVLSLQFNSNASDNEDKQLDATKPYGPDMNFYSISADGRKLAIDARPYEGDKAIPLGVKSAYQQDFVIRAETISVPAGGTVTLHDKLLNKYVEMKEGTEYRFTIGKDKSTQGDERFELVLKPTTAAAVKGLEVSMAPNPASDDVKITFTSGSKDNVSVRIMDVSGVSIYNQDLGAKQNGVITVPMSNFAAGVYMVEITQGDQKITKRLVKE